jgi:hypothetical protein
MLTLYGNDSTFTAFIVLKHKLDRKRFKNAYKVLKYSSMGQKQLYSKRFKQIQTKVNDPAFLELVKQFKNNYKKVGLSIPNSGFTEAGLNKWMDKISSRMDLNFEEGLNHILEKSGLDPKNDKDYLWLYDYIFLNRNFYQDSVFTAKFDGEGPDKSLWVRIYGHTRADDIDWKMLIPMQKQLLDYVGKNKNRSKYIAKRNAEVKKVYKTQARKKNEFDGRSPNGQAIAKKVFQNLEGKYPELSVALIRKVIGEF